MDSLAKYRRFVREHPDKTKTLEEALRMGALMLPTSRLGDRAELASEVAYSALGLLNFYHDTLIASNYYREGRTDNETQMQKTLRTGLTLLSNLEVTLEMCARSFGGEHERWRLIHVIECTKAAARIYLLIQTDFGTVLQNGGLYDSKTMRLHSMEWLVLMILSRNGGHRAEQLRSPQADGSKTLDAPPPPQVVQRWTGKRSGKSLTLPPSSVKYVNSLLNLKEAGSGMTSSPSSSSIASTASGVSGAVGSRGGASVEEVVGLTGELLHICRPVIYVMVSRAIRDKRSWVPLAVSLAVDLLSARCSSLAASPPARASTASKTATFRNVLEILLRGNRSPRSRSIDSKVGAELKRRRMLLLLYLMRDPLFSRVTLAVVKRTLSPLENVALLKFVASAASESLDYYHRHHFYVSAS